VKSFSIFILLVLLRMFAFTQNYSTLIKNTLSQKLSNPIEYQILNSNIHGYKVRMYFSQIDSIMVTEKKPVKTYYFDEIGNLKIFVSGEYDSLVYKYFGRNSRPEIIKYYYHDQFGESKFIYENNKINIYSNTIDKSNEIILNKKEELQIKDSKNSLQYILKSSDSIFEKVTYLYKKDQIIEEILECFHPNPTILHYKVITLNDSVDFIVKNNDELYSFGYFIYNDLNNISECFLVDNFSPMKNIKFIYKDNFLVEILESQIEDIYPNLPLDLYKLVPSNKILLTYEKIQVP